MRAAGRPGGNVRLVSAFNFLCDLRLYAPVAVIHFAAVSGSFLAGMAVFSAAALAQAALELPTGVLSDAIGRKRTMVLGAAASTLAVACYALAGGPALLFAGAILEGLSRSLYSGNNEALLYESLKEEGLEGRFHDVLGKASSWFQVALAVGAVAGGFASSVSFCLAFGLSVVPQALSLIAASRIREPARAPEERGPFAIFAAALKAFARNRRLRAVASASILADSLGEACYQFNQAFVASLWPTWAIGASRALSSAGAALGFRLAGRAIDRFGELPVMIAARLGGRALHALALAFPWIGSPVIMASSSLLFGPSVTASGSFMQRGFSEGERATMGSVLGVAGSACFALVSAGLGALADAVGVIGALLCAQAAMLIPTAALIAAHRGGRKEPGSAR